jgi:transcriptional regulator with XRE-family HTH domain
MADIKKIRKALRLDQHELARKLGISQSAVSKMETGERAITRRTELQLRQLLSRIPRDRREGLELDGPD